MVVSLEICPHISGMCEYLLFMTGPEPKSPQTAPHVSLTFGTISLEIKVTPSYRVPTIHLLFANPHQKPEIKYYLLYPHERTEIQVTFPRS